MEIRDLKYFRAVVEAGGVTRAAELLHMTAGALSKALGRFEADIGRELFRRSGRNLVTTEAGRMLYAQSARLLAEHKRLVESLDASPAASPEILRIATFEVFSTYFAGALLASHAPDAEVQILDVGVGAIETAVADRTVDVGLTYAPQPARGLHFRKLARIEFAVYAKRGAFDKLDPSEIPFAIPTTRLQLASGDLLGIDSWPYHRVPRLVKYRLTMLESALALARRGLCAVFLPTFIGALHNAEVLRAARLVRLPSPPAVGRVRQTVHLVSRDEDSGQPRVKALATAAKAIIASATET